MAVCKQTHHYGNSRAIRDYAVLPAFSALTLLVGRQEGHRPVNN